MGNKIKKKKKDGEEAILEMIAIGETEIPSETETETEIETETETETETEKDSTKRDIWPEQKASWASQAVFSWAVYFLDITKQLSERDLPALPETDRTAPNLKKLKKEWNLELKNASDPSTASLKKAIWRTFAYEYMIPGVPRLMKV